MPFFEDPNFTLMSLLEDPNIILLVAALGTIILAFLVLWLTNSADSNYSQRLKKDAKLEQNAYPDKNLPQYKDLLADFFTHIEIIREQHKNIFALTIITIIAGFLMISYGGWLYMRYAPSSYADKSLGEAIYGLVHPLPVILAGILTELIAVMILFIYRAVSQQTEFHFKSLERLTTVGIAVQILDDLDDDQQINEELKSTAKADIAKKLLDFYVNSSAHNERTSEKNSLKE